MRADVKELTADEKIYHGAAESFAAEMAGIHEYSGPPRICRVTTFWS
jgi:hypothetical protein